MADGAVNPAGENAPIASPPAFKREVAVITDSQGVHAESVRFDVNPTDGVVRISFMLETETLVEPRQTGILREEPIVLAYESIQEVGTTAPLVLSGRADFPKNLGHLNPVLPGFPASFCLARAGLQPIYDRYGIEGVMTRLRTWMRDAQTGGLMIDGWEPVPLAASMPLRGGLIDAAAFQDMAAARRGGGWTTGAAKIVAPEAGDYVLIDQTEISAEQPAHNSALCKAVEELTDNGVRAGVPWVFVWSSNDQPIPDPVFGFWKTYKDMTDALAPVALADRLQDAIGRVLANGCDCKHAPGRRTLVVIIGLFRPGALADNIFGLSTDSVARRLEIKAFTLEAGLASSVVADDTKLRGIISDPLPGPALFRWTTATPMMAAAGLIGDGALGNRIADHLLRSGIEEMHSIDSDSIAPHNLARHGAEITDIYKAKVEHLKRSAAALAAASLRPRVRAFKDDVTKLSDGELADRLGGSKVIIDASADERVRGRLSKFSRNDGRTIIRVEIYDRGRLGTLFATPISSNPNLLDLYYLLCRNALDDDAVAAWLFDEHVGGSESDELLFGFGCASNTIRLPNYVVSQHAAAFMPTIVQALAGGALSGIGLNRLDQTYRPIGWSWFDAPQFGHFNPATAPGWTVHVHPDVLTFLSAARAEALPNESGGYLYGGWDLALKQIVIVAAGGLPPGSTATETALTLGPAGNTAIEKRIARRTRGRLYLCGSWHSHTSDSTALSRRDEAAMAGFRLLDQPRGIPTLFLVVAQDQIDAHLQV